MHVKFVLAFPVFQGKKRNEFWHKFFLAKGFVYRLFFLWRHKKKNMKVIMNKIDHFKVYDTKSFHYLIRSFQDDEECPFFIVITVDISCHSCDNYNKITVLCWENLDIFHFLGFYIILCPPCDVTSHLTSINQNLEKLGNQECYHNKINAILAHFERWLFRIS